MVKTTNMALLDEAEYFQEAKQHWLKNFAGMPREISLQPDSFSSPQEPGYGQFTFRLESDVSRSITELGKGKDLLVYVILLSSLKMILHYYTSEKDITVGSPVHSAFEQDAAYNSGVLLRDQWEEDITFKELLMKVNQTVSEAYRYQYYPMNRVLDLAKCRHLSLFKVIASYENIHDSLRHAALFEQHSSDLVLRWMKEEDEEFVCIVHYRKDHFLETTIQQFMAGMTYLLRQALDHVECKLSQLELISETEKKVILGRFNQTETDYPRHLTIPELFEKQVEQNGDQQAVLFGEVSLTYRELNERANEIAWVLRAKGVSPGTLVGLMAERSVDMVAGIIGIMKSGGAYLPIDPDYPEARIQYIVDDSRIGFLLLQSHIKPPGEYKGEVITFETIRERKHNLPHEARSTDLAYVIYTSGSTGNPKGVMVEHKGVSSLKVFFEQTLNIGSKDRIAQFASSSFDASVWEISMALLTGAALFIPDKEDIEQVEKFTSWLNIHHITVITLPPTYAIYLQPEDIPALRMVITAGSEASHELVNKWKDHVHYLNAYGPTESTVCATIWSGLDDHQSSSSLIPMGQPITNTRIYILHPLYTHQLQPIGLIGEICIAGEGLARGYLYRPDLTAQKFIEDPFREGEMMYRTGDLGKWMPDGTIIYLGRSDHQVKIRGYRIETGEVAFHLMQTPDISEVEVIAGQTATNDTILCAYFTASQPIDVDKLRGSAQHRLPAYMIPNYFVQLKAMPLTPNGKIDRNAFPDPASTGIYVMPTNDMELQLVEIWQELFDAAQIGINDHFFNDLGGHSLKASELAARLHQYFGVNIPLQELFRTPTIVKLAPIVSKAKEQDKGYSLIERAEVQDYYPLSSAQQSMFITSHFNQEDTFYNLPMAFEVEGDLRIEALQEAFEAIILRHEILRTTFHIVEGEPKQRIHDGIPFEIERIENCEEDPQQAIDAFIRPFSLQETPLMRVRLVKFNDELIKPLLLFDVHHIAADGVSLGILVKELMMGLQQKEWPASSTTIQYKDYCIWNQKLLKSAEMEMHKQYWLKQFSGELPGARLPTDYPRQDVPSTRGDRLLIELDEELTRQLKQVASEAGATLNMILLSIYSIFLAKYSGKEDVVVGSLQAGRNHVQLEPLIGMFVNTLALRCRPNENKEFFELLQEIKETTLTAYKHQDYPFEELVNALEIRNARKNPLFDTMFILQNAEIPALNIPGLELIPYEYKRHHSRFEFVIEAFEQKDTVLLVLSYFKALYDRDTILQMGGDFRSIAEAVVKQPDVKIKQIQLTSTVNHTDSSAVEEIDFNF